jgi:hypothetical protein
MAHLHQAQSLDNSEVSIGLAQKVNGTREQLIQLVRSYPLGTSHYMTVSIQRHSRC